MPTTNDSSHVGNHVQTLRLILTSAFFIFIDSPILFPLGLTGHHIILYLHFDATIKPFGMVSVTF